MTVHNCVQNLANLLSSSDKQTVPALPARRNCVTLFFCEMPRRAAGSTVTGVWQVRYATGAIRNISVEEVGKRIVKAIPDVLQQLNSLSSSQDQVIFAAAFAPFVALVFVPRASLVNPPSLSRRPRPVTLQQPSRACRKQQLAGRHIYILQST
jgi:hypothetical protein